MNPFVVDYDDAGSWAVIEMRNGDEVIVDDGLSHAAATAKAARLNREFADEMRRYAREMRENFR